MFVRRTSLLSTLISCLKSEDSNVRKVICFTFFCSIHSILLLLLLLFYFVLFVAFVMTEKSTNKNEQDVRRVHGTSRKLNTFWRQNNIEALVISFATSV